MPVRSIPIEDITIPSGRREPLKGRIASVARSMLQVGQLQPIGLNEDYRLIWGRTRLEACRANGWKTIDAVVLDVDEMHAELAEIDENIERSNLSAYEEGLALARRKAIYLELHPETAQGVAGAVASNLAQGHGQEPSKTREKTTTAKLAVAAFAADTAEKTGKSERVIQRDIATAEAIAPAAGEIIKDTPLADQKGELEALAKLPEAQQIKVAKAIKSGKAKRVKDALPVKPATPADTAKAQLKVWIAAVDNWLSKSPTIDELRAQFPGKDGDRAVTLASQLSEAMKNWKGKIK